MSLPRVVHVLPLDLARGAQRYARAMRYALDGNGARHRTLTIFESSERALDADIKLDVPQTKLFRAGLEPRAVLALARALEKEKPEVVVAHGSQPLKYLTLAAPLAPVLVYYKIGVAHARAYRPYRRKFQALLLRRAARIAGVSRECLDEAAELFSVPRDRLVFIPNGRDPELFFPADAATRSESPVLTFVGHLSATKRPERFVRLVRRLRDAGVEFRARMIGAGPLLTSLGDEARAAGIEVLGRRDDVPELLRDSDVFIFTSVPDGEGMPGVFIEAGLSGVPVVTTDVPGARTVVAHGETGYVVGVDDFEDLVEKSGQLLRDGALRRSMGAAARRRCEAQFSLQNSIERWAQLFDELLRARSAAS